VFADLHLHSNFSDGTYTPEELAGHGQRVGLTAMALTDHDTVEGCLRMTAACAERNITFVPGTELTAEIDGLEVHILGLFIDPLNPQLLAEMAKFQNVRQERIHEMVAKLNEKNVPLRAEAVFKIANCRAPGRPHVGRALVQAGICSSLDEAFDRFLKKGKAAWVPKFKMSAHDAIRLIHTAGGLAVLAHPALNRGDEIIPDLVASGMDGIECFHSKHSGCTAQHYLQIADQHGLLVTGGSDCHGMSKNKPLIGSIKLPIREFEKLQAAWEERRPKVG
jgi:predicted metal-dependent phosphoesterase TrpH